MNDVAISVRNLSKKYRLYDSPQHRLREALHPFRKKYHKEFWALKDISFEIQKGHSVGIIGQNGSGKSTLLQTICGVLQPTTGTVQVSGRISALLELGAGFNPEFTGRQNVFMNGAILGLTKREMENNFEAIENFAEIGDFVDQPVKTYSSGMYVRLAFSVAINVNPEILVVDEALAVGDVRFQARCFDKLNEMRNKGVTIIYVTHAMQTFQSLCDYGICLDAGSIFADGNPKGVSQIYYRLQREREHAYQDRLKGQTATESKKPSDNSQADTLTLSSENEFRFGIQTAKIVGFKVLNDEGLETRSLQTGKEFKVWIKVEFYDTVENPTVAVMIRNPQGQNLLGIHSLVENKINFGKKENGDCIETILKCEMLLNPGSYTMTLSIADHKTFHDYKSIDVRHNVAAIHVIGKEFWYGLIHNSGGVSIVE